MRLKVLFAGMLLALGIASNMQFAFAEPLDITGLTYEVDDGTIKVRWKPAGNDIAFYRVYYSASSILKNSGEYDDFEQTEDMKPEFVFSEPFPGKTFYVAVLAVSTTGEESEFFTEELMVDTSAKQEPVVTTIPVVGREEPETTENSVSLLSTEALSSMEVLLTFSDPIVFKPSDASALFSITSSDGEELAVKSLSIRGTIVLLQTAQQQPGAAYELTINDVPDVTDIVFDEASRKVLFTGFGAREEGAAETPTEIDPNQPTDNGSLHDVRNFRVSAVGNARGLYDVTADWDRAAIGSEIAYLLVGQSFDNGKTFFEPNLVPANALNLTLNGVPAGPFGLLIQTMDKEGKLSPGIFAPAQMQGGALQPPRPVTNEEVIARPIGSSLPTSGAAATAVALAAAGSFMGWRRVRKNSSK